MKDYTFNKEDRKMFILNYKIKKDNIIVKLATGEKYIVPYTIENEQKILERMKEQVTENIEFERKAAIDYILTTLGTIGLVFITMLVGRSSIPHLFANITINTILSAIPAVIVAAITIFAGLQALSIKNILDDFRKNKIFIDKEDEINNNVRKNVNMLSNVSSKTKNIIKSTQKNESPLDINKVDKVTSNDLRQILENIKRDEEFEFEYEPSKPKKLIRQKDE